MLNRSVRNLNNWRFQLQLDFNTTNVVINKTENLRDVLQKVSHQLLLWNYKISCKGLIVSKNKIHTRTTEMSLTVKHSAID